MSSNQLTTLPDEIGELKELGKAGCETGDWRLNLSDNQLTKLPDEIGELKELEWLDV